MGTQTKAVAFATAQEEAQQAARDAKQAAARAAALAASTAGPSAAELKVANSSVCAIALLDMHAGCFLFLL